MSLTSDRLSEVFQSILPVFDINSLRIEQEMALYAFLAVKDVFVNLPTSPEKSIIYQPAPLVFSRLEELSPNSGLGKSDAILVVIFPLISLMFFAHSLHSNTGAYAAFSAGGRGGVHFKLEQTSCQQSLKYISLNNTEGAPFSTEKKKHVFV